MIYTRWFQEVGADDLALVGGKGANLGEMVAAVLPVPGATAQVREGQRITVDGNRGIVLLETGGATC
jgi:pyruvate,water dikinase